MTPTALADAARYYAGLGWPVIPLHAIFGGSCTCGREDCASPGKHPRTPHGLKDASVDPDIIASWWRKWPAANVGVVTGAGSGLVVLDIDPRHGGDKSLTELTWLHGELPETVEAATGGGGQHLFFMHPGEPIRNRANIQPGIDVRGDGGYVVVAPSVHVSGGAYSWLSGHAPGEIEPASLPRWLLELLTERNDCVRRQEEAARPILRRFGDLSPLLAAAERYALGATPVAKGARNSAAFNLAGHLAAFTTDGGCRLAETQIAKVMCLWNERNQPPLADRELRAAVRSAMTNGVPRSPHVVSTYSGSVTRPRQESAPPTPAGPARLVERFEPLPVDVLPEPVRGFVVSSSKAIGCDSSFVALPLLSALAAAIGNTRRIQLKRGWTEPAIIWAAIVGDSGTLKSPALELALRPIRKRQQKNMQRHSAAIEAYATELAFYERALAEWKRGASAADPPRKPAEPAAERCFCDDITIEALATLLMNRPRGLLLARDELAGWLGGFDRYAQGKGGDAAKWLEMFGGRPVVVDRKGGNSRTIYIPQAAVSIAGGIQPETLRRALGVEHRENGLAARLLLSCPPRRAKRWTEAEIDEAAEAQLERLFERLYELQPDADEEGEPRPRLVKMTPAGKAVWVSFYNAHAAEHADLTGDLSAVWSKLEGYAARLALVVHFIRWAAGDPSCHPELVDEVSVMAGVKLSRWFGVEARRVYAIMAESEVDRDRRRLVEWIASHGGAVTVRELTRGLWRYRGSPDGARAALEQLQEAGLGHWVRPAPDAVGGRPTQRFELIDSIAIDETAVIGSARGGFVDGDGGDDLLRDEVDDGRYPPCSEVGVGGDDTRTPRGAMKNEVFGDVFGGDDLLCGEAVGGRPTQRFELIDSIALDETAVIGSARGGFVDDGASAASDEEWGEI